MHPQLSDSKKLFIDVEACTNYFWKLSLIQSYESGIQLEIPDSSAKSKRSVMFDLNPTIIPPYDQTKYKYPIYVLRRDKSITYEVSIKRTRYLLQNRSVNAVLSRRVAALEASLGEEEMAMRRLSQANAKAGGALVNAMEKAHRGRHLQPMDPSVAQWYLSLIDESAECRRRTCRWDEVVKVREVESTKDDYGNNANWKKIADYEDALKQSSDHRVLTQRKKRSSKSR